MLSVVLEVPVSKDLKWFVVKFHKPSLQKKAGVSLGIPQESSWDFSERYLWGKLKGSSGGIVVGISGTIPKGIPEKISIIHRSEIAPGDPWGILS